MLLLSAAVPQRNYVGVLIDDSRSMRIADRDGKPRSDWVEHAFGGPDSAMLKALRAEVHRPPVPLLVGRAAHRQRGRSDVQRRTRRTSARRIEQARQELDARAAVRPRRAHATAPTTRARRSATSCSRCARSRFRSSPSDSAPSGSTRTSRFVASRRRTRCSRAASLVADLLIRQRGYAGQRVPLVVEDGGRIVSRDSITLPPDGDVAPVRVTVVAHDAGPRSFTFRIPLQPGEQVEQNNVAAGARRRARRPRENSLRRRRAALRDALHSRGRRGRLEPPARRAAAHGREQVSPPQRRHAPTSWRAAFRRRAPSCFSIARSSSAASKRASSRTISSRCSPSS